jgi:hypothetical protein
MQLFRGGGPRTSLIATPSFGRDVCCTGRGECSKFCSMRLFGTPRLFGTLR